ncbi:MAG: triose-phosphate isomerase [Lentimicrobium sp.]|jgi:triosephosphate isomerase|nr:triose-phosphate isomerase [Lentimicrobium sp.]MDD2528006.1 triose-phosphate isomerase [Lentimicrobiaceae bacterium]MDD4597226.1 triose-phosphate isomerase [Lentimicrobiaceae bacterium]MDY0025637.1 triose-phosphate isomerase [Lentimicrobium sp.]HAH58510.1 triose-phosphate isomerase [Bacteroidales bacterium]
MRKKIVAGNWKMNKVFSEAEDLLFGIADQLKKGHPAEVTVVVFPPVLYLELANDVSTEHGFGFGVQNISEHESGAYTGEISAAMVQSMGAKYVILGHSERRQYFGENDNAVAKKIELALRHELTPIYCCGEALEERENGHHFNVVESQLSDALFKLSEDEFKRIIIAYEPVWAIGTGRTATPEQAQEMHAFIRSSVAAKFGHDAASEVSILYGGSCNASNAAELFANPDVDGGLIGGASLKPEDFVAIVNSFGEVK